MSLQTYGKHVFVTFCVEVVVGTGISIARTTAQCWSGIFGIRQSGYLKDSLNGRGVIRCRLPRLMLYESFLVESSGSTFCWHFKSG